MSPASPALPLGKSRRNTSGKGRFDPSEPLHMTTRKAARQGQSNGTPSLSGSADDEDSRRGSFDDIRPATAQSAASQISATGRRISGSSTNGAAIANMGIDLLSSLEQNLQLPTVKSAQINHRHPQSPTRKRKRSPPTSPDSPAVLSVTRSHTKDMPFLETHDAVEVVPFEDLSDQDADSGSESDDAFEGSYLGVAQSTELTPAATPTGSQAVSPVSELSNSVAKFSAKNADAAMVDINQHLDEAEEADEVEDVAEVEDVDGVDEVDDQDDQDRVDGKLQRRLAGRRRADHPLADIEATMRRQLKLKSAYRAIARALKPVLAEMALKTMENLESDPVVHEQVSEYQGTDEQPGIQTFLDNFLERRKSQLEAQLRLNREQLLKTFIGEQRVCRSKCDLSIEDSRRLQLETLEHDLLIVARRAQLNDGEADHETDNEDGDVVPRPHQIGHRFARCGALDPIYDSRSRRPMEAERAIHDLQLRFEMHKMLQEVHEDSQNALGRASFTVMDDGPRRAADGKKQSIKTTRLLADAAAEAERLSNHKPIPNEEAHGLQMLGDLASRPSIRLEPKPAAFLTLKYDVDPFGPLLHQHQQMAPPPPMRAPFDQNHGLPVISPRTAVHRQPLHFEESPLPSGNRLELQQRDHSFLSPKANAAVNGTENFPPLPDGTIDHETTPRRQSVSQLPAPGSAFFGQSARRPQEADHPPLFGALTLTREDAHREHYQRPLTMERETRQSPDRVVHTFSSGPLSIERVKPHEEQSDNRPTTKREHEILTYGSPTRQASQAVSHWEPPSSPGAVDSDQTLDPLLRAPTQDLGQEGHIAADPRSRASSIISQSTGTEASPDETGAPDYSQSASKVKVQKSGNYPRKAGRADRNGLTRKIYKTGKRQSQSGGREKGPSVLRFRLNQEVGTTTPTQPPPWPQGPASGPPYPYDYYGPPPWPTYWHGPPPPWAYTQPPPGYWAHRNSVPPPGSPYGWQHGPPPPQSPLYAVPPGAPPSVAPQPEQWSSGPPPHYGPPGPPPPPPPPPPLTPQPQSAGAQKPTNPPLAPNMDPRLVAAGPSNHPPAFAQQQRQSSDGSRRRAQSDTQHTKFKQYQPRPQ